MRQSRTRGGVTGPVPPGLTPIRWPRIGALCPGTPDPPHRLNSGTFSEEVFHERWPKPARGGVSYGERHEMRRQVVTTVSHRLCNSGRKHFLTNAGPRPPDILGIRLHIEARMKRVHPTLQGRQLALRV